ncbi:hypothetical protein B1J93_06230 [Leptospira kirschneri serovar Pomona]|uniref:Uncharacterized protein n=1 Tax=Leptospira kirschneri serovar Pomona TaxID=561005 RepID=A0A1T1DTY1_9LEPT|nr:hypothetical protein B1J93_06230 [Leptospira kirschneri serovar Pomona]
MHRFYGRSAGSRFRSLEVTQAVSLLRSLEVTQRLASTVARSNSASRFYGRSTGRVVESKTHIFQVFRQE